MTTLPSAVPQKVLIVLGTRPEAIKLAPVILALKKDPRFDCHVCSTGQHKEMLQQVLDWFEITPCSKLDVMTHNQPLATLSGKVLAGLQEVISAEKPDIVMVQGDTTTAFMGALAAYYSFNINTRTPIKIAHVEAGLRTNDLYSPYPEEANRRLIGPLAHWHFAPTHTAEEALLAENLVHNVFVTGNTVIDALMETKRILEASPRNPLPQIPLNERIILVTGHRRESYGEGFHRLCLALRRLSALYPDTHIVYPVHLNPNVKGPVMEMLGEMHNIHLTQPMDYPDFVAAMMRAHIILTDSGGVQEEAPSLGKPVLVLRDVTERPEAVMAGTVKIVGTNVERIINEVCTLMDSEEAYNSMASAVNPYGDGLATGRILNLMAGERGIESSWRGGQF